MNVVNVAPWMQAMESQLDALRLINLFINSANSDMRELKSWGVDRYLLETAAPFAWSDEVVKAVMSAGASIPLDTPLNRWNLDTEAVWWRFENPLPFQTVTDPSLGVRALCFGWMRTNVDAHTRLRPLGSLGLPVCVWTDGYLSHTAMSTVAPSHVFEWEETTTLGEMLEATRRHYDARYGPGGPDAKAEQIGVEIFMATTEALARFILAGLAWLGQKVLVAEPAHVERHRRKDYVKRTGHECAVHVVHLRKQQYDNTGVPSDSSTEWSCRWVVGGHWRNQVCGPKHGDRKLTWIMPYVKGPDDKPFKASAMKVYEVSR